MINFLMILAGLIVTNLYTWHIASKLAVEDVTYIFYRAITNYEAKNGIPQGTIFKDSDIEVEIEEY